MNLKHLFREYFSYTASEKKGLFVLVTLLLILYLLPFVFKRTETSESIINQEKQKQIDSLISSIENRPEIKKAKTQLGKLESFDPNKVNEDELHSLGFTSFQTSNLIKFRNKGGRFKEKTDLLKIYGVNQSDFDRLNDYILISVDETPEKKVKRIVKKEYKLFPFDPNVISSKEWESLGVGNEISNRIKKYLTGGGHFKKASDLEKIYGFNLVKIAELIPYVKIEGKPKLDFSTDQLIVHLNSSDTMQLKQLPGIGSSFSARIVKYRELLGGFVSKDQLLEVYGISKEKFIRISPMLVMDSVPVRRIGLNSFDAAKLRKHPYIDSRMSKDIVRFRDRNGNFTSIDQLQSHKIVSDSIYLKLIPYLELK
jgi:competence protein ComEA